MDDHRAIAIAKRLEENGVVANDVVTDSLLPKPLVEQVKRRNYLAPLTALQQQLPATSIIPVPDYCRLVNATTANYVERVELAGRGIQLVSFMAFTSNIYLVSFSTRVVLPLPATPFSADYPRDAIVAPNGIMFYAANLNTISVGIVNQGDVVSVLGWSQIP